MRTRHCARCSGPVVEIALTVEPDVLVMRSCNRCGRSWYRGDEELRLADVAEALVARDEMRRSHARG